MCGSSLVSVGQLLKKGIDVHFVNGDAVVKRGEKVFAVAKGKGNLFILTPDSTAHERSFKTTNNIVIWHQRFGHADHATITQLPAMVSGMPAVRADPGRDRCRGCLLGKMTRVPFRDVTNKATKPLQRVYMDLCGPMKTKTLGGRSYFLLITDEFTRFRRVYMLRKKSEALDNF